MRGCLAVERVKKGRRRGYGRKRNGKTRFHLMTDVCGLHGRIPDMESNRAGEVRGGGSPIQ